jgi:hypothetical protein
MTSSQVTAPRDNDPVHVPRWAFRLAGGTILMGMVAFFTTALLLFAWLFVLTAMQLQTHNESRKDRNQLRVEIQELKRAAKNIEKSTKAVAETVAPDAVPRD